jgi:LL-diaminopimelate aminotransferase
MIQLARRMEALQTHFFANLRGQIAALEAAGRRVIRLDEGSPDLTPSPAVIAALCAAAARPDVHGYPNHNGPPALRRAWADLYRREFAATLDPERQVLPTIGSKEAIFHLTQTLVGPGDVVIVPDPGYVTYTQAAHFAGAEVWGLPLTRARAYLPDLAAIPPEILRRARLMWLNYPHNPTTAVAPLDLFAAAFELSQRHDFVLAHDAAYTLVTASGAPTPSLMQVPGAPAAAVEVNSLSKSHSMAGWRVGAAVGAPEVLAALLRLKTNQDSGQFAAISAGAVAALDEDRAAVVARGQIYAQRRAVMLAALRALGLEPDVSPAGIYVWTPLPPGWDSAACARAILSAAAVSVTPGRFFGPCGEGSLRLSLTNSEANIREAGERLAHIWPELTARAGSLP